MASRGRLGGLSALTPAAMVLMRAVYDVVLVETVGVGQAETEVAAVSDSVVFCVQPGSGDSLQYLKAGIAEIPDVAVVTKADLGLIARRTEDDLRAALAQQPTRTEGWSVPVLLISAQDGQGIAELAQALADHHALLAHGRTARRRSARRRRPPGSRIGCARSSAGRGLARRRSPERRTRSTKPMVRPFAPHARAAPPSCSSPNPQRRRCGRGSGASPGRGDAAGSRYRRPSVASPRPWPSPPARAAAAPGPDRRCPSASRRPRARPGG